VIIDSNSVTSEINVLLKTTRPHTDQTKNKPQDLLVNTSSGNQARSQKF